VIARIAVSRFFGRAWYETPFDVYYAGFILVNWLALAASAAVFLRLIPQSASVPASLLPLAMLLMNGVTKAFFWTPHTQVFNVLIPVLSCAVAVSLVRAGKHSGLHLTLLGFCCGLLSLIYGAFILILLTAIISILWSRKNSRAPIPAGSILWALLAFSVPLLAWRQFVIWKTGSFYMHEVSTYRQFVWLADSLGRGMATFLSAVFENLRLFIETVVESVLAVIVLTSVAIALCHKKGIRPIKAMPVELRIALGSFVVAATPFFALMGYYTPRLSWELAPPALVILAWALSSLMTQVDVRVTRITSAVVVAVAIAYTVGIIALDQSRFLRDEEVARFDTRTQK
jgi:hypothetical protein